MKNQDLAFGKLNYIVLGVGIAIIVLGFILMSGDSTTSEQFCADIFSDTRIKIAPMTCLLGFVVIIVAILIKPRQNEVEVEKEVNE